MWHRDELSDLLRVVIGFHFISIVHCEITTVEPVSEPCNNVSLLCELLEPGQYYCSDPVIDAATQREEGCTESHPYVEGGTWSNPWVNYANYWFSYGTGTAIFDCVTVDCFPAAGICCNGQTYTGSSVGFRRKQPCSWTNGKKFNVALLLSIFVGWLGIDRFYLGYPALGLLKLCTFGFMLIWTLIDILLIALQIVGPADGSEYVIDYYGPGAVSIVSDNMTYVVPPGSSV